MFISSGTCTIHGSNNNQNNISSQMKGWYPQCYKDIKVCEIARIETL